MCERSMEYGLHLSNRQWKNIASWYITYPVSHEGESILVYIHPDVESAVTVRVHIASTWRAFNIGQADGLKNKCDLTTAVTVGIMLRINVGAVHNQFPWLRACMRRLENAIKSNQYAVRISHAMGTYLPIEYTVNTPILSRSNSETRSSYNICEFNHQSLLYGCLHTTRWFTVSMSYCKSINELLTNVKLPMKGQSGDQYAAAATGR